jgi:thymus-specific serine protease
MKNKAQLVELLGGVRYHHRHHHAVTYWIGIVLFFAALTSGTGNASTRKKRRNLYLERKTTLRGHGAFDSPADDDCCPDVQELYFEKQRLDHFHAGQNKALATFRQRYFYTSRFVYSDDLLWDQELKTNPLDNDAMPRKSERPLPFVFCCMGGEGPELTKHVLLDSEHCSGDMLYTAQRIYETQNRSVHLYALEHRYYGQSYPQSFKDSPVTNENLEFLSSRQALMDLVHWKSIDGPLPKSHALLLPWITWGGSYPGVLATWARTMYPRAKIMGAVANSSPIQPVLNFAAYNNHVANVFGDGSKETGAGGSLSCLGAIEEGHAQLVSLLLGDNRQAPSPQVVAETFGLCDSSTIFDQYENIRLFLGDNVLRGDIQGNNPACLSERNATDDDDVVCNIATACSVLLNQINIHNSSAWEALAYVALRQSDDGSYGLTTRRDSATNDDDCFYVDWRASMEWIRDPIVGQQDGLRSWLWQTCTEFGFYQTCEHQSACPYGRGFHTLADDLFMCDYAFNRSPDDVIDAIHNTVEYYGGWNLEGTTSRILSVTGTIDPWTEMAKTRTSDPVGLPVYRVPGASHHFWTHAIKASDSPEIVKVRDFIFETVSGWIDEIDLEMMSEVSANV